MKTTKYKTAISLSLSPTAISCFSAPPSNSLTSPRLTITHRQHDVVKDHDYCCKNDK